MPEVTAVVGNYRGERLLPDVLASLAGQTLRPREVVVVDARSDDDSVAVAERAGARVLVTDNRGLGHLYNCGARAARTELVLLVNNDIALAPACVELLADALAADRRRFAADPTQLDWSSERVIHARSAIRRGPLLRRPLPGFDLEQNLSADGVTPTLLANGAAMLVRRDLLLELGGFDETFFLEFEEVDLCWRAWARGAETVYVPAAQVRHRVGEVTSSALRPRRLRSAHHNLLRFALKCLPAGAAARVVAGELMRLPRHPALVAPAVARIVGELPEIARERRTVPAKQATLTRLLALGEADAT